MEISGQGREADAKIAFGNLLHLLGGTSLLRTIIDDAQSMHKQGFDGAVFGDACEDEPPTFTIAARDKGIEFALGNEGSHVLPLQIVEDLLEAGVPAEDFPPMAA